jgi:serine/threonine-protein kinase
MGTLLYCSPEQLSNPEEVDERSEIYAFRVVLYEMLTGQRPHKARNIDGLIMEKLKGSVETPRRLNNEVPLELADIVLRCLEFERTKRKMNLAGSTYTITTPLDFIIRRA